MSEVQYSFFFCCCFLFFVYLSSFLYPPPGPLPLLQNTSTHVNLRNATLFPFWQGPWLSRWHVDVKHQRIYCHAPPWWQKSNSWTHPFCWSRTGNVSWVCVFMKISPSCQIWETTLGTLATAFIYYSSPVTSTSWMAKAKLHSWVSLKMRPHILYSPLGGCWSEWGNYLDTVQSTSN